MKVRELIAHLQDDIDPDAEVEVEVRRKDGWDVYGVDAIQLGISFTRGAGRYTATLIAR